MKRAMIVSSLAALATTGALALAAAAPATTLSRDCWNTDREKLSLVQKKAGELELTKNGKACDLKVDPTYPNAHVPAAYQSWKRYFSTFTGKDGRNDPCSLALGIVTTNPYDSSGDFSQLRIDGKVLDSQFKGSAQMEVGLMGDGSGPLNEHYICR